MTYMDDIFVNLWNVDSIGCNLMHLFIYHNVKHFLIDFIKIILKSSV